MSISARNPYWPGALTVADLVVGRKVRHHFRGGYEDLQILSKPQTLIYPLSTQPEKMVQVRYLRSGSISQYFLGDLGVSPFFNGRWSNTNYVTAL